MSILFKNNATTTLVGSINNTQTSITVTNASSFPVVPPGGDYFYATMYESSGGVDINIEIVKVTETVGNSWTVERAQDDTVARARGGISDVYVELRWTAATANAMIQKVNNLSDLPDVAAARTNLGLGTLATQNANSVNITGGTISGVVFDSLDSQTTIKDNADPTKAFAFEVSGVSTGTTRTLTIPDKSGTLAMLSDLSAGYQPLDADLTALAALAANGLIARTGSGTVAVRAIGVPAAGLTITNGDGVSGNPTLALADDLAAVEALATTGFVRRTGVNTWTASALLDGDLPSALTSKTYNGLSLTANATGFSLAGGTTSKTLTIQNSITLNGTDGTTITLPTVNGTLALNNQTMYLGTTAVAINRGSGALSLAGVSIDGSAGSATTAGSATKATNLVGGNNTTLLGAIPYQSNADTTTLLAPNTTASKQFLAMTGTGTNGANPVWSAVSKSDVGLGNVENTALSTWAGATSITTLGTIATGAWQGTAVGIAYGGTGATNKTAAFDNLSPLTTLGDTIYFDGTDNVRLAGNTTTTRQFLRQTGTGTVSAAPAWDTLVNGDIPTALTGKTYNGLTLTAAATGFTIAGGTTSKTLTISNTLTLAGTDSSTLNIGAGGTLGSAAFTASTAYAPAAGSTSITSVGTLTAGTWNASTIGISYGGTGATTSAAAFNNLSPITTLGDLIYGSGSNTATRLAGNTTTAKQFLTQTGTGSASAAPAWGGIANGDLPNALTGKTYNGLSLTANTTGFSVAGGTTSKTLVVNNNLTLSGTDGATLYIGAGGTLGTGAFATISNYLTTASAASTYAQKSGDTFTGQVKLDSSGANTTIFINGGTSSGFVTHLISNTTTTFSGDNGLTSSALFGNLSQPIISNSGVGGSNGVTAWGGYFAPQIVSSGASALIGAYGVQAFAERSNAADISTNVNNALYGGFFTARHTTNIANSTATTTIRAVTGSALVQGGTATDVWGVTSQSSIGSSSTANNTVTVTNYAQFMGGSVTIGSASNSYGTVTNYYGLYLTPPTVNARGTITNRWGVYAPDALSRNHFAGNVLIGTTTDDGVNKLQVSGSVSATQFTGSAAGLTGFKTVNGNSILGTGNIVIAGGVTSFNTRTGAVSLTSGDVTTALGYTPANKAGDTFTGNLTLASGTLVTWGGGAWDAYISGTGSSGPLVFGQSGVERARFGTFGHFFIGKTADDGSAGVVINNAASSGNSAYISLTKTSTGNAVAVDFLKGGSRVGYIGYSDTSTTYYTSSDHRLKEFVAEVTGSGKRLDALRPVEFRWKVNGQRSRGFFAHEFQAVYAESVTGTKDAVDSEGKPIYQAMQAGSSEVIADLVAEIKSLRARVAALE